MAQKEKLSELEGYDLERLLTALFPDLPGNPFEGIDSELQTLSELLEQSSQERKELAQSIESIPAFPRAEFAALVGLVRGLSKQVTLLDDSLLNHREHFALFEKDTEEQLDDIQTRTFGILILQIVKTLKFFLSLVPKTKYVLFGLSILSIIVLYLDKQEVTAADVNNVLRDTGLASLLQNALAFIESEVAQLVSTGEIVADEVSGIFQAQASDMALAAATLRDASRRLTSANPASALQVANEVASSELERIAVILTDQQVLAGNARDLIAGVLREQVERIRRVPQLVAGVL